MVILGPESVVLTDRVTVVTGAASGVGAATARAYARFGADVAICDRNAAGLAETAAAVRAVGRRAIEAVIDVRHADAVRSHIAEVAATFGKIDVLVNNAGGSFLADFMATNDKGQQAMIDENFTQCTTFIRECVPFMSRGAGGSIINITSIEAGQAAPGFGVYAAMKAAMESLTESLALELGPAGIRVNAIALDAVHTAGDANMMAQVDQPGIAFEPTYTPPLGWFADADDAAGVCVFLAGDLSRFVTGCSIAVDGGNGAAKGWRRLPRESNYRT